MKNLLILLMFFPILLYSQNDYNGEPCVICDLDCIECSPFTTIVNQIDTLYEEEGAGDGQGVICTFFEHQITWYGFIAGSEDLDFSVTSDSCTNNLSLEAGIYSGIDCSNFVEISDNCYGGANGNALSEGEMGTLSMTDLVIGQYYWLIIDGTSVGATFNCWFTISITNGSTGAPAITDIPQIDGPPTLCNLESGDYSVINDVIGASEFEWYVDGLLEDTDVDFTFNPTAVGTYEICAQGISYCETGPLSNPCFEVVVSEDSFADIAFAICSPDCIDYLGNTYCTSITDQIIIPNATDCDSIIDVSVTEVSLILDVIEVGECVDGQGVELLFVPVVDAFPPLDGSQVESWDWYFNGVEISGSNNQLSIFGDVDGIYTVMYSIEYLGATCMESFPYTLDLSAYAYDFDPLFTYGDVCPGEIVDYELSFAPYTEDLFTVNWTVPADAIISMGQGSPVIEVAWIDTGGDVCYTVTNFCATSDEVCFPVEVLNSFPPDIEVDSNIVCLNESFIVTALDIPSTYISFAWNLDSETALMGGSLTDPSQIEISISTLGVHIIGLFLNDGCEEYTIELEVEVVENPTIDSYDCLVSGADLQIVWTDNPDLSNYTIISSTPSTAMLNGASILYEDLTPGQLVEVELEATGPCGIISSMFSCLIPDCPVTDMTLESDLPDTLCINNLIQEFEFTGMDLLGNVGVSYYQGPGISDTINGVFDIGLAGTGQHILSYTLSLNNGDCLSSVFDTVFVFPEPLYEIESTLTEICIGDTIQIFIDSITVDVTQSLDFDNPIFFQEDSLGHFSVAWDTEGTKTITSTITHNFCGPYIQELDVEVSAPLDIELSCTFQGLDEITIGWTDNPLFNNYNIYINGIFAENVTGDNFSLTGLSTDSTLTFQVEPIALGLICPLKEFEIMCSTTDCVVVPIEIETPMDTTLCGNELNGFVTLDLMYDMSLFDGTETLDWSGNGVSQDGMLDLQEFEIGSNVVTCVLYYNDCSYTDQITFEVLEIPELDLMAPLEICITDDWVLEFIGDENTDFDYQWQNNAGVSLQGLGPHQINFDQPGYFTFELSAMTDLCSVLPIEINVEVQDSVRTPIITCMSGLNFINISWSMESDECLADFTILLDGNAVENNWTGMDYSFENLDLETDYQIEVIANSDCPCDSKSSTVECATIPCITYELEIDAPSDTLCQQDGLQEIQLDAFLDGVSLNTNLEWSGPGIGSTGSIAIDADFTPGTYDYTLIYTEGDCFYNAFFTLEILPLPELNYTLNDPVCPEDSTGVLILNNVEDPDVEYFLNGDPLTANAELDLPIGNYELMAVANALCSTTVDLSISEILLPEFLIDGPSILPFGGIGSFEVQTIPAFQISQINWSYNDTPIIEPIDEYVFSVSGILCAVFDYDQGCMAEHCIPITIDNPNVYLPNIISLAEGSSNNNFGPFSNADATVEYMRIYDRWGDLIFNAENLSIQDPALIWDGRFKDKHVNQGVYVYNCLISFTTGESEKFTGDLTVVE